MTAYNSYAAAAALLLVSLGLRGGRIDKRFDGGVFGGLQTNTGLYLQTYGVVTTYGVRQTYGVVTMSRIPKLQGCKKVLGK